MGSTEKEACLSLVAVELGHVGSDQTHIFVCTLRVKLGFFNVGSKILTHAQPIF